VTGVYDAPHMQAVQLTDWQRPAIVRQVPRPQPGPGEILLQVRAAGLCHSDLHLMHWPAGAVPYELPFTLGHEVAGDVAGVGPGAEGVALGDSVIVYGPWGCGRCPRCSLGEEHLREARGLRGRILQALTSCRIVAVDRRDAALELAARDGADVTLTADGLTARDVRRAAGGRGAALVIDCVGVEQTLELAASVVAPGGHVSILGVGGGTFPMRFGAAPFETSVVMSNWGTRSELADVVALARGGAVRVDVERVRLDEVPAAYERLESGAVRGRLVAVPDAEGGS
jgi:D-arabinose 1-dehydrogenase-like Zn-dependent alcohol dehydrogenase